MRKLTDLFRNLDGVDIAILVLAVASVIGLILAFDYALTVIIDQSH